jgi:hypothetical protein
VRNPLQTSEKEARQRTLLGILQSEPRFNLRKAAQIIGVKPSTIQYWRSLDHEFARQLDEVRDETAALAADELEDICHDVAKGGDVPALKFLLQAHKPERYRQENKGLTNNGTVINVNNLTIIPRDGAELPAAPGGNGKGQLDE